MESGINNVNIEKEMSDLAENTLRFKFATKKVAEYYKTIQNVLGEAGKS
jgi:flagellar basal-body rod protein FlgB